MIQKVNGSGMMERDMKASLKMASCMDKVRMKWFTLWFIYSNIVWWFLGKYFWNNENRYEGEWKDGK